MSVSTYTAREIRDSAFLTDKSVSIITSHGIPVKVTIPFDERMVELGVHRALALHLVENHLITHLKGAKLADLSLEAFFQLMAQFNIPAIDLDEAALAAEITHFSQA